MQLFDLPLDQLQTYKPEKTAPKDFSEFWKLSLEDLAKVQAEPDLQPVDYPVDGVKVYRLTYKSFGNARITGWYAVPDKEGPHPAIVKYHGYNASYDGEIHEMVNWALHATPHSACLSAASRAARIRVFHRTVTLWAG